MKTLFTLLLLVLGISTNAQTVDILDINHKVIKTVQEKDLDKEVKKLGTKAQYTARWKFIKKTKSMGNVECKIKRKEIKEDIT